MINFRNCSTEVSEGLNVICDRVYRATRSYSREHNKSAQGQLTVFVGRKQYHLLCMLDPYDAYGAIDHTFMSQRLVEVMLGDYLVVVANDQCL